MKQQYAVSQSGRLEEVASKIKSPDALILITSKESFNAHVARLEELYPGVPSIAGMGISYAGTEVNEKGTTLIAFYDVKADAGAIEHISEMPVKYTDRLKESIKKTGASAGTSACLDFTCGEDGRLVTTFNMVLDPLKIPLVGGTVDGPAVAADGKVYEGGCVYLILKNNTGKIKAYKENIYEPTGDRFVATKTNPKNKTLVEVNGKPAARFYQDVLSIPDSAVATQTFKNPFGRVFGNETYLISIKEINGSALDCYKQVNDMDVLTLMELKDYKKIVEDTLDQMKRDIGPVSGIFSVNCLFRYLLFNNEKYFGDYLRNMNRFGSHAGLVGVGEHYCRQHVNQTMCGIAFS